MEEVKMEEEKMQWLKGYLYKLYKDNVITSDQLYDMSEIFGFKDDYDYSRHKRGIKEK